MELDRSRIGAILMSSLSRRTSASCRVFRWQVRRSLACYRLDFLRGQGVRVAIPLAIGLVSVIVEIHDEPEIACDKIEEAILLSFV